MHGRFLLDTNVLVAIINGEPSVAARLRDGAVFGIPSIALGELYYGAAKSGRSTANAQRIEGFITDRRIFECSLATAREYGLLKAALRRLGRPLPENDIWIAAIAIQNDLTLVSRDTHFESIEGLKLARW